jgi:hypothetical protein
MPGSESLVALSEMLADDEVTFHEGKGVKGSASVVVGMLAARTASHCTTIWLGDRMLILQYSDKG